MKNMLKLFSGMQKLESLAENDSFIHRLHPGVKIIMTFAFLITVLSFDRYQISGLMPFFFYPILMMGLSQTPWNPLLGRLLLALPFSLFGGLSNIIFDQKPAFFLGSLVISYGFISFVSILIRTILSVMAVLILISTTPMTAVANQLIKFKVPRMFVLQIILTYRYISVIVEELSTMTTAYMIRSSRRKGVRIRDAGPFIGHLLIRSIDRAERVYLAMLCRGFHGIYNTSPLPPVNKKDIFYGFLSCSLFVLFRLVNTSVLFGHLFSGGSL